MSIMEQQRKASEESWDMIIQPQRGLLDLRFLVQFGRNGCVRHPGDLPDLLHPAAWQ